VVDLSALVRDMKEISRHAHGNATGGMMSQLDQCSHWRNQILLAVPR
jgi:hypothetical protein